MKAILVLTGFCVVGLPDVGYTQGRPVVEFEGGVGYVFGGGGENPGSSLATFDAAIVVWPAERWGFAIRRTEGPGEDLHAPIASLDRTFLGEGHLHYWTATVRHRRPISQALGFEMGFGVLLDGEFATVQMFHNPPRRSVAPDTFFNGFSLEALLTRGFSRYFAAKAGMTYDFNFDTANLQPVALAVVRF
jgi:hypothetical protein